MDRLLAINASLTIVPAGYQMMTFLAAAHGYKHKQPENKKPAALHPGGAIVHMFPDGVIRLPGFGGQRGG